MDLRPADKEVLESWTRASTMPAGLVQRARIVLLAGDGLGTGEIMAGRCQPLWDRFFRDSLSRRLLLRLVDPGDARERKRCRRLADEALRVGGVGTIEHGRPLRLDGSGSAVVDVGGRVIGDAGMAMLVVVPTEEPRAEAVGVFEAAEAVRELGPVLEGLELALAKGLSFEQCGRL